jgi:hypothetical protein
MQSNKYDNKIKEGVYNIFKTEVVKESGEDYYTINDGLITVVDEPLVRQQLLELTKLCERIPSKVALKAIGNRVQIEFWQ